MLPNLPTPGPGLPRMGASPITFSTSAILQASQLEPSILAIAFVQNIPFQISIACSIMSLRSLLYHHLVRSFLTMPFKNVLPGPYPSPLISFFLSPLAPFNTQSHLFYLLCLLACPWLGGTPHEGRDLLLLFPCCLDNQIFSNIYFKNERIPHECSWDESHWGPRGGLITLQVFPSRTRFSKPASSLELLSFTFPED